MDAYGLLNNVADAPRVAPLQPMGRWRLTSCGRHVPSARSDVLACKARRPASVPAGHGFSSWSSPTSSAVRPAGRRNRNRRIIYTDGRKHSASSRQRRQPALLWPCRRRWRATPRGGPAPVQRAVRFETAACRTPTAEMIERFTRVDMATMRYEVRLTIGRYTRPGRAVGIEWVPGEERRTSVSGQPAMMIDPRCIALCSRLDSSTRPHRPSSPPGRAVVRVPPRLPRPRRDGPTANPFWFRPASRSADGVRAWSACLAESLRRFRSSRGPAPRTPSADRSFERTRGAGSACRGSSRRYGTDFVEVPICSGCTSWTTAGRTRTGSSISTPARFPRTSRRPLRLFDRTVGGDTLVVETRGLTRSSGWTGTGRPTRRS